MTTDAKLTQRQIEALRAAEKEWRLSRPAMLACDDPVGNLVSRANEILTGPEFTESDLRDAITRYVRSNARGETNGWDSVPVWPIALDAAIAHVRAKKEKP